MRIFRDTCIFWLSSIVLLSGKSINAFSGDYSATTKCPVEPQRAKYGGGIIVNPAFDDSVEGWAADGVGEVEERASEKSINAFLYDYSATTKCLVEPQRAQNGGGIIVNPDFDHSLEGWSAYRLGEVEERISTEGNRFIVVNNRRHPLDSLSQEVQLEKGKLYSFSAWIQISEGREPVSVVFRTTDGELMNGGKAIAEQGCWSLLKGGIVANFSSPMEILFESQNTKVEIWIDSVSLQPFTKEQWRSHQEQRVSKVRKSKVRFQVTHANKTAMQGALVSIKQLKSDFPFGCGMNYNILKYTDYQNWFASRFHVTTFTNEMKWYSTEKIQGQENYTVADAMVKFCKHNGISIRGHNIFWDNQVYQPDWVKSLSPEDLREAAAKRLNSVVSRYKGELIAWDVVNENLHFRFYEDKLGENASAEIFSAAHQLDPSTRMFMNEYNTIEYSGDEMASAVNYRKKLQEIQQFPGNDEILMGIGVQGHFGSGQPNLAYMRSSLDILGSTGLPIWLTEVSVEKHPNQAQYLEEILREGYSHPAVQGIVMFMGPEIAGFKDVPLADASFGNTPAGDVVDKLLAEWVSEKLELKTDDKGYVDALLFHGDYNVTVQHPDVNSSTTLSFRVTKDIPKATIDFQIQA